MLFGLGLADVKLYLGLEAVFYLEEMGDFVTVFGLDPFGDEDVWYDKYGHVASRAFGVVGTVFDVVFVLRGADLFLEGVEDLFASVHALPFYSFTSNM